MRNNRLIKIVLSLSVVASISIISCYHQPIINSSSVRSYPVEMRETISSNAALTITVLNCNKQYIANAKVKLHSERVSVNQELVTGNIGMVKFMEQPPADDYQIIISVEGYKQYQIARLLLTASRGTEVVAHICEKSAK